MSRLSQVGGRLYRGEISYDFVGRRRRWYAISGAILVISIVALLVRGLDFSVDFKGGAVFQFSAPAATQTEVSDTVAHAGVNGAVVQQLTGTLGHTSWRVLLKGTHPKNHSSAPGSCSTSRALVPAQPPPTRPPSRP